MPIYVCAAWSETYWGVHGKGKLASTRVSLAPGQCESYWEVSQGSRVIPISSIVLLFPAAGKQSLVKQHPFFRLSSLKREEQLVIIRCFQALLISAWLVPTFTPLLLHLGILRLRFSLYLFTDLQVHTFLTTCPAILVCQLFFFFTRAMHATTIAVRITLTEPQNKSGGQSGHRQCHTGAKW